MKIILYFMISCATSSFLIAQELLNDPSVQRKIRQSGISVEQAKELINNNSINSGQIKKRLKDGSQNSLIPDNPGDDDLSIIRNEINNEKAVNKKPNEKDLVTSDNDDSIDSNEPMIINPVENVDSGPGRANEEKYYGYNVFNVDPEIFQKSSFASIDPDYPIGPGDEVVIMVWGETELYLKNIVSRDGFIFLSDVGQVFVNGLTLNLLEKKLFNVLKKVYSSLEPANGSPTTFFDVTLGSYTLKPVRVFVLGEVEQPGAYSMKFSTTLFNSLYYFGGPTFNGSLRRISLVRSGKEIKKIDFYDYLLTGKQPNDIRLQRDDVIFINPRENTVEISGEIGRPAVYELQDNETLLDLIKIAGGLLPTTYTARVQIDRVLSFDQREKLKMNRTLIDLNLSEILEKKEKFKLQDGDKVKIFKIFNESKNIVQVQGEVRREGWYDLGDGLFINDLINKADGLSGNAYLEKAEIVRIKDDGSKMQISINLSNALKNDKNHNIALRSNDILSIYNKNNMLYFDNVKISGHVSNPGSKPFMENMTVADLVFAGGGFENKEHLDKTYFERADLITVSGKLDQLEVIEFRLDSVLNGGGIASRKINMGDEIKIYSYDDVIGATKNTVNIVGYVKRPGEYPLFDGLKIKELLFIAGGLDDSLHLKKTFLKRADLIRNKNFSELSSIKSFDLGKVINADNKDTKNFDLLPGDTVRIYSNNIFKQPKLVSITGSIVNPGIYNLKNQMTLRDLVLESGGFSDAGVGYKAEIASLDQENKDENFYASIHTVYLENDSNDFAVFDDDNSRLGGFKKRKDIILKPEDKITIFSSPFYKKQKIVKIGGLVHYPGEYVISNTNETVADMINRAGGLQSNAYPLASRLIRGGKEVKISFRNIIKWPRSRNNFIVSDGDSIYISSKTNMVTVTGAVNSPGVFQYLEGKRLNDYINDAGGYSQDAARFSTFVKYPDGKSEKRKLFKLSPIVEDGSEVVVVPKIEVEPFSFTKYAAEVTGIWADLSQAYLMIILASGGTQ